jgi:hypothetical protein
MRGVDGTRDLTREPQSRTGRHRAFARDACGQGLTGKEFHSQEDQFPTFSGPCRRGNGVTLDIKHATNVRMGYLPREAHFLAKAGKCSRIMSNLRPNHLERDTDLKLGIEGFEYLAHSALGDFAHNAKASTEFIPRMHHVQIGRRHAGRYQWGCQIASCVLIGLKEVFDLGSNIGIAVRCGEHKLVPFADRYLQCRIKDPAYFFPAFLVDHFGT